MTGPFIPRDRAERIVWSPDFTHEIDPDLFFRTMLDLLAGVRESDTEKWTRVVDIITAPEYVGLVVVPEGMGVMRVECGPEIVGRVHFGAFIKHGTSLN